MAKEFDILGFLALRCSVTPKPTVVTTLSCSPSCYSKLARSHPSLHRDAELIGGYVQLYRVAFELNFARVKQLAPLFRDVEKREIEWDLEAKGGRVVCLAGKVGTDGEWEKWEDLFEGTSTMDKIERCWCFGCGDLKEDGTDLVSALKSCGVEEVRAALVEVGFDLNAFDSR